MAMEVNLGLSKKPGPANFGPVGVTCNLELEMDQSLLQSDLEGFQRVRRVCAIAAQAVSDELARQVGARSAGTTAGNAPVEPAQETTQAPA
jgi:cell division protein FtsX